MQVELQVLLSGLTIGAVYALLALGLVVTYKTTKVLNLAHGETFVIAAVLYIGSRSVGLPVAASLLAAIAGAAVFNAGVERYLLRPRADWSPSNLILITLGVAFAVQGLVFAFLGPDQRSFAAFVPGRAIVFGGAVATPHAVALIASAGILGFGTVLYIERSKTGKQFGACAENPAAAALLGVDVPTIRMASYVGGGALGGIAGVLLVPLTAVDFHSGLGFTLRGFIVASMGGMVSTRISVIAGLLLGVLEMVIAHYLGTLMRTPIVFTILIVVALISSRHIAFGGAARA